MDDKKANCGSVSKPGAFTAVLKHIVSQLTAIRLKSKTLLTLTVAVLAFIIVVSVMLIKCSSTDEPSVNKTDESSIVLDSDNSADTSSVSDITEDTQTLSVTTEKTENQTSESNNGNKTEVPPEDDSSSEAASDIQSAIEHKSASYVMYCGKFQSRNSAEEKKANIAISTGLSSKIISKDSLYSVLLGPFNTREEAVSTFDKLDSLKLIDECELEEQN